MDTNVIGLLALAPEPHSMADTLLYKDQRRSVA